MFLIKNIGLFFGGICLESPKWLVRFPWNLNYCFTWVTPVAYPWLEWKIFSQFDLFIRILGFCAIMFFIEFNCISLDSDTNDIIAKINSCLAPVLNNTVPFKGYFLLKCESFNPISCWSIIIEFSVTVYCNRFVHIRRAKLLDRICFECLAWSNNNFGQLCLWIL